MTSDQLLHILLIDDEEIVHQTLGPYLRDSGHHVDDAWNGVTALQLLDRNDYDIAIIDVQMPGIDGLSLLSKFASVRPELSSVIITGHGNMEMVIRALRLGAADFLTKPVKLLDLDAVLEKSMRIRSLRQTQRRLRENIIGIQSSQDFQMRNRTLIGNSKAMQDVKEKIQLAVDAHCETILITGETGTGKEVVARGIHFIDLKDESPFIAVSCPALPDSLVESELFGHVKGAFTGATMEKPGYFEMADGGTLFLDEIADLSPSAQAKLLRVLETRSLRRVGGAEEKIVKIRIVAATNVPLERLVETKNFRQDLFYRLNVFTINLLPLRERRIDIIPLAEYFLSNYITGRGFKIEGFSSQAKEILINYDFPGNARELRNIVECAAIICRAGQIDQKHLNIHPPHINILSYKNISDEAQERARILKALEESKWNRNKVAQDLGIPYSTLRYKMKKFGIV